MAAAVGKDDATSTCRKQQRTRAGRWKLEERHVRSIYGLASYLQFLVLDRKLEWHLMDTSQEHHRKVEEELMGE